MVLQESRCHHDNKETPDLSSPGSGTLLGFWEGLRDQVGSLGDVLKAVTTVLSQGVNLQIAERHKKALAHVHDLEGDVLDKYEHKPEITNDHNDDTKQTAAAGGGASPLWIKEAKTALLDIYSREGTCIIVRIVIETVGRTAM